MRQMCIANTANLKILTLTMATSWSKTTAKKAFSVKKWRWNSPTVRWFNHLEKSKKLNRHSNLVNRISLFLSA